MIDTTKPIRSRAKAGGQYHYVGKTSYGECVVEQNNYLFKYSQDNFEELFENIPEPEEAYCNIYMRNISNVYYKSKELADYYANPGRVGCVKLTIQDKKLVGVEIVN